MRKLLILVCSFALLTQIQAATYYVKVGGGTGSGLDDANAWSYAKFLDTFSGGNTYLFKRGDVFYGTITMTGNNITFGAYGTGANPVISGLTTLSSWTQHSSNVYYATLDVPTLNMVTLDNVVRGMGRYPNTGYLPYTSHSGNNSISGTDIGGIGFDPTGGEVVLRKLRYVTDRHSITSRSGNTLNLSTSNDYGNNNTHQPVDGNGFFIQSHLSTVDSEGDWYYDNGANRLYMHFGAGTPSGRTVKASSLVQNVYMNYWTGISFTGIDFEGGNLYGAYIIGTGGISFTNCHFRQQGGYALWGTYLTSISVTGGSLTNSLNHGIMFEQDCNNVTIDGVTVDNSGMIAGAASSGDLGQSGMHIRGDNLTIQNCTVTNSGYNGIAFIGNNALVTGNTVDGSGYLKDDGGGIYTWTGSAITNTNRVISNNTVRNSLGTFVGAEGHFYEPFGRHSGIYLDDYANNTTVTNNVVETGGQAGIFLHNTYTNQITGNRISGFQYGLLVFQDVQYIMRNNVVSGNTIRGTGTQKLIEIYSYATDNMDLLASFSANRYYHTGTTSIISLYPHNGGAGTQSSITMATWKATYGQDLTSALNPKVLKRNGKLLKRNGKLLIISQ